MQSILDNADHSRLLTKTSLPGKSWLYEYIRWFSSQEDMGRRAINARYGEGTWEKEFMSFDTFRANATMPLQYVFADHHIVDVFIVDNETRKEITRLWFTALFCSRTTSILGIGLLPQYPCIESIQNALLHAIWPKTSHQQLGFTDDWLSFGIPLQLSLDNAWAHHSHSVEDLSRSISRNGQYNSIDLMFRPPYMGRYGALIERFFGNFSGKVKERLVGSIQSSSRNHIRNAAREAALLYEDIWSFIHEIVLEHQNTPRKELDYMTPNEKWLEGVEDFGLPQIPQLNDETERLFWRMSPETRQRREKGISFQGLHYWSPALAGVARVDRSGKPIEYSIRSDMDDISHIAIFKDGNWLGDVFAKELRQPDGSYKHVSEAQRKIYEELAISDGRPKSDWLKRVNETMDLNKRRTSEKKKAQNAAKRPSTKKPSPKDILASDAAIEGMV